MHSAFHHSCEHQDLYNCAGVRQSLATVGSLLGSGIASAVFILSGQSYVTTFAAAAVPPVLALTWLFFTFKGELRVKHVDTSEPPSLSDRPADKQAGAASKGESEVTSTSASAADPDDTLAASTWLQKAKALIKAFRPAYWQAIVVVSVLYFGRFDFAWVTLRAQAVRLCLHTAADDSRLDADTVNRSIVSRRFGLRVCL